MFKHFIWMKIFFFILFFIEVQSYSHPLWDDEIRIEVDHSKVDNGKHWELTVTFDGQTETYDVKKDTGANSLKFYGDKVKYNIRTDGKIRYVSVVKQFALDHKHEDNRSINRDNRNVISQNQPVTSDLSSDSTEVVEESSTEVVEESLVTHESQEVVISTPTTDSSIGAYTQTLSVKLEPIKVTEYMLRNFSKGAGGGLPQWIEIYNPNNEEIDLIGYSIEYASRKFVNHPFIYVKHTIESNFKIAAKDTIIISNKSAGNRYWNVGGISDEKIYIIPRKSKQVMRLKLGWHITDLEGNTIHRIGKAFQKYPDDDPTVTLPHLPIHNKNGYRVSHKVVPSENPAQPFFYGNKNDVGSPGFFKELEFAPAAPSLKRKKTTTWGYIKLGI